MSDQETVTPSMAIHGCPAILLCAGYGTRMGSLTSDTPKPLLPVAGRPMIDYLVDQILELPSLGAIHVVTNHHYQNAFESWAAGWSLRLPGERLVVHDDGSTGPADRLGAIGDLEFVLKRLSEPSGALVAAGDNILRFSLEPLWKAFESDGRTRVLALHEPDKDALRRTGVLALGAEDRVLRLEEKPANPPSEWACPSLYALSSEALGRVGPYLASGRPHDEIGRFVAYLVDHEPVFACRTHGERLHVGSPEAYRHADAAMRAHGTSSL